MRYESGVTRWSTVPVLHRENNGTHMYHVARIADLIHTATNSAVDWKAMMRWALIHDADEALHGDLPSPSFLANHKPRPDVPHDIYNIVKMADVLDAYMYLNWERRLGNNFPDLIIDTVRTKMIEAASRVPGGEVFIGAIFES
jgi:hypothetical protein